MIIKMIFFFNLWYLIIDRLSLSFDLKTRRNYSITIFLKSCSIKLTWGNQALIDQSLLQLLSQKTASRDAALLVYVLKSPKQKTHSRLCGNQIQHRSKYSNLWTWYCSKHEHIFRFYLLYAIIMWILGLIK